MSGASSWALQAAIFSRLSEDSGLAALVGGAGHVFDAPPAGAGLPYAVLGPWKSTDESGADAPLLRHEFQVRIWSAYRGHKETKAIAAAVEASLTGEAIEPEGERVVLMRLTRADFAVEAESGLAIGTLTFDAMTQPAE